MAVVLSGKNQRLDQKQGRPGGEEGVDLPDVMKEERHGREVEDLRLFSVAL